MAMERRGPLSGAARDSGLPETWRMAASLGRKARGAHRHWSSQRSWKILRYTTWCIPLMGAEARTVAFVCGAEILGLAGFSLVPRLLPQFIASWSLSNAEAGWLAGMISAGYMAAVLPLVGLTDRVPACTIFLACIGKSRLTAALSEQIESEPHTRLRYVCSPYHQNSALHPVIGQSNAPRDPPATTRTDKARQTRDAARDGAEIGDISLIAEMLSLSGGERFPPLDLSPQRKKERTLAALLRQLQALARRQPMLMIFEELHWIDPTSRELLDLTVEKIGGLPVLLVATYRPEFQPPWVGQSQVTVIALNRLGCNEGATLVHRLVGNGAGCRRMLPTRSSSAPTGCRSLSRRLTKAVVEFRRADRGYASIYPSVPLCRRSQCQPPCTPRCWGASTGSPPAQDVAQVGAAIGREFSYELIEPVAQRPEKELQVALDQLRSPTRISSRTSKSSGKQHDGSGIEEGSRRGDGSLEVLGQTTIAPEPCEAALDDPASGMHGKADLADLLAHDLDDDAGGVRHALGGVGTIGEHPLDEWQQPARRPQQRDGTVAILNRSWMDLEHDPSTVGIDHRVTLAAVDLLAGIIPPRTAGFRGLDALAVDDGCTRAGLAADTLSIQHHQIVVQVFPGSVIAKPSEPSVGRLMRWEVLGQHAPGTAATQHKEDRVHQFAHRPAPMPAGLGRWWQQRREYLPLCVGQVTGVTQVVPVMLCPGLGGPHRRLQI